MKATDVVKFLEANIKEFGDQKVHIETELNGARSEQAVYDVLVCGNRFLLVSAEACAADPINHLPEFPNLSAVPPNGDFKPH